MPQPSANSKSPCTKLEASHGYILKALVNKRTLLDNVLTKHVSHIIFWTMWHVHLLAISGLYKSNGSESFRIRLLSKRQRAYVNYWRMLWVSKVKTCNILRSATPFLSLSIPCETLRWVPYYLYQFGTNKTINRKTNIFGNYI